MAIGPRKSVAFASDVEEQPEDDFGEDDMDMTDRWQDDYDAGTNMEDDEVMKLISCGTKLDTEYILIAYDLSRTILRNDQYPVHGRDNRSPSLNDPPRSSRLPQPPPLVDVFTHR